MAISGAELVYALKKATVWNTAVVAAAGDGFKGLPMTTDPTNDLVTDDSVGQLFATDATPGLTKLDPMVPVYARYNDKVVLSMLAAVFGTAGAPATHTAGTLSKDHTLKIAKNTDGLFFTLVALLGTGFVDEVPSWKIAKLVATFEVGKPIQFAFSGPGVDLVVDSEVNTVSTFNSVTILETANRAYMAQTEFRMNDQSAGALDGTAKIAPSKAVLTLERKLSGVYGAYVAAGAGHDLIDQPTNDGPFTGSLELTYPRLADNKGQLDIKNLAAKKAEIICTGPIIEGAIPCLIKFQLPHLKPKNDKHSHKQGIIDNVRAYEVLGAIAAPLGMTGNTDPCWCFLTNKIATDLITGA
jgi:hypothetical protein